MTESLQEREDRYNNLRLNKYIDLVLEEIKKPPSQQLTPLQVKCLAGINAAEEFNAQNAATELSANHPSAWAAIRAYYNRKKGGRT